MSKEGSYGVGCVKICKELIKEGKRTYPKLEKHFSVEVVMRYLGENDLKMLNKQRMQKLRKERYIDLYKKLIKIEPKHIVKWLCEPRL